MAQRNSKRASGNVKMKIMEAAFKVFGEHGFERSTTKAIAQEAGVAEGTIFNYFPTKRDILFGFLENEVSGRLPEMLQDSSTRGPALIKSLLRSRLDMWRTHQAVMKVMVAEALFKEDVANEIAERVLLPGLRQIESYIAEQVEAGVCRPVNPGIAARGIVGQILWFGLIQPILGEPEDVDPDSLTETLASIFWSGVALDS